MRYLITTLEYPPFLTFLFEPENHFCPGMVVYDLKAQTYTTDGVTWIEIEIDVL